MNKKNLFRLIKVVILIYCLAGIVLYYGQEKLIFAPIKAERNSWYNFSLPSTELNLNYDQNTNLNIVEFRATDRAADSQAKGVVLFFHGKGGNISSYTPDVPNFTANGYEVWMMDYPGYGKSTGSRDEASLYKYSLVFYKLARSRWKPEQIILCGKSLGTGIAAQLAAVRDCRRLILESPYYSLTSIGQHRFPIYPIGLMMHWKFPTYEFLPRVTAPVTIFEGDQDRTVPYSNSERLKPFLKAGDEFVTVEGAGHNDLYTFPLFHRKLDSLLKH
jgi:pimeloyl-ACP methyl ester carboxylesterase